MTEPAITALRQRMIEDMAIRRLVPGTQAFYVSTVAKFAGHFRRSSDLLGYEEVRTNRPHLVQSASEGEVYAYFWERLKVPPSSGNRVIAVGRSINLGQ